MKRDLHGKVVVITGAGSGIGRATALACAARGMPLVIAGRRAEKLERVALEARALGPDVHVVSGDVVEKGFSARLLDAAAERFGHFDVVFANAGYGIKRRAVDLEERELRNIFEVNFFAANDLLCEAARRLLAKKRPGHLLMCSSSVARFTLPEYGAYCATKSAQAHVCAALRMELKPHGIDVSIVFPITTRSEFFDVLDKRSGGVGDGSAIMADTPKAFIQSPRRVAAAVVRCLEKPVPEVWTSRIVRCMGSLFTWRASLMDRALGGLVRSE